MRNRSADRVALVTGASSGIGRAAARAFARGGAHVVVADVNRQGGQETVRLIKNAGGRAIFIRTDVSRASEVEMMIEKAVATFGRLDCAHNNAGVLGDLGPTRDCSEDNWDYVITNNLKSVWLCLKFEIRYMLEQGGGTIVNTSSIDGLVGARGRPAYVASKHGIVGLTKAAALEYARSGIRVNAVCPGAIRTPMKESVVRGDPEIEARVDAYHPIGRQGLAEEVAEAVVWLCSDAASFVTGHALVVDGGVMAF